MRCQDAEMLMMKYMDGDINEIEAKSLNEHILSCEECRAAFFVYDSMITEMEEMPAVVEAPEGFETQVMAKITALQNEKHSVYSAKDRAKMHIGGSFAIFLCIGALMVSYKEAILASLSQNPAMGEYVANFRNFSSVIAAQTSELVGMVSKIAENADRILTSSSGIILGGIVILCGVQAVIARRKNR